jgi:hypothetical protein
VFAQIFEHLISLRFLSEFESALSQDDEALRSFAAPCVAANRRDTTTDSLVRILLSVQKLQSAVWNILLQHLATAETSVVRLVVSQMRWLETIYDGDKLRLSLEEFLPAYEFAWSCTDILDFRAFSNM